MQKELIEKLKIKNKTRIEFIIFLFLLIFVLQLIIYNTNLFNSIKEVIILLILLLEFVFLIFNILIIITNNKLKKIIEERKQYFNNIIQKKEDDININNIIYKKEKHLTEEEIDRIDIFSKKNREIISDNLIEGTYKNILFKSYNLEINEKTHKYTGKWIILDTLITDNISIYISSKKTYKRELVYPKNLFDDYKDKNNKVLVKNGNSLVDDLIELKNRINKDMYISIINDKFQILIFKEINDIHIEKEIKEIYKYLDNIFIYKEQLQISEKEIL